MCKVTNLVKLARGIVDYSNLACLEAGLGEASSPTEACARDGDDLSMDGVRSEEERRQPVVAAHGKQEA